MKETLLVVDDDPSVRESLERVLASSGYHVILAADGKQAQRKLDNPEIDLLILDLNMPHRDGWDVLEDASIRHPLLPVIIITGMMDQLATTLIPGVGALMEKPIDAPLLLKRIELLLEEPTEARLRRRITGGGESGRRPGWARGTTNSAAEPPLTPLNKPQSKSRCLP
jgi:DNA-binding response OmpR family regulator